MKATFCCALAAVALISPLPASADVITDWNERAVALVNSLRMGPPPAERVLAMTHVAMFDAVNSIERRYRPYLIQIEAPPNTSKEAAAAAAAGTVLAGINPQMKDALTAALTAYLVTIPDSAEKAEGVKLGQTVAAKVLESRANDGARAPDTYRPRTTPGVYVPTAATWAPQWPGVKPFAMTSGSQFRPEPPLALTSKEWATDLNEIKGFGGRESKKRSPQQDQNGRFWLAIDGSVYYPIVRQVAAAREMGLLDCARLLALTAVARADGLIAVFEAKYHYDFWRPVSAIRNADIDNNPATERDAAWQPIAETPMHPEYPCAHCISASTMTTVLELVFGSADIPEVTLTSPTLPGVTHRWTNLRAFSDEVAEARIWSGFHYRFSSRAGQDMGRKIGEHVVRSVMQPVAAR